MRTATIPLPHRLYLFSPPPPGDSRRSLPHHRRRIRLPAAISGASMLDKCGDRRSLRRHRRRRIARIEEGGDPSTYSLRRHRVVNHRRVIRSHDDDDDDGIDVVVSLD